MRRRPPPVNRADEPPARLRAFDPVDWLPLVDVSEYHADDWRDVRDHEPVGPVKFQFEDWRLDSAWHLWSRARLDWCGEHGWLDGRDYVELLQEAVRLRRAWLRAVAADDLRKEHG